MIAHSPLPFVKRLLVPGYLILGVAFLIPLIDLMVSTSPSHWGDLRWRFGFLGTLSSGIAGPILVLFFIYALGLAASDRRVAIACAVIAAFFTITLAGASGAFALDALQMKRRVPASGQARFDAQTTQATVKLVIDAALSLILLVSILRTIGMGRLLPADAKDTGSLLVGVKADTKRIFASADEGADESEDRMSDGELGESSPEEQEELSGAQSLASAAPTSRSPETWAPHASTSREDAQSAVPAERPAAPKPAFPAAAPAPAAPVVPAPAAVAPTPVATPPAVQPPAAPPEPSRPLQAPKSAARAPSVGGPMRPPPPKKPSE